jgi:hypothetical protein
MPDFAKTPCVACAVQEPRCTLDAASCRGVRRRFWAAAGVDVEHCLAALGRGDANLPQVCCEGHVANAANGVHDDHR